MEENNQNQENNFWASYSDVFTTVAIIFLTLFLFSIIKSGISSLETAMVKKKHEEELKGKLSEKDIKESELRKEKIEKSINQIGQYQNVIDDKLKEINTFAAKMNENKKVMQEIIKEQNKKDAILHKLSEQLEKNEQKIVHYKDENQKIKTALAQKEQELTQTATELEKDHNELEQVKQKLKEEMTNAKNALAQEKVMAQERINNLESKYSLQTSELQSKRDQLEKEINELKTKTARLNDFSKDLEENNKFLTQEVTNSKNQVEGLKASLKNAEAKYKSDLKGAIDAKNNEIQKLQSELQTAQSEYKGKLADILKGKNSEIEGLKGELASLQKENGEQAGALNDLQKKYDNSQKQIGDLKEGISKIQEGLRAKIAGDLAKKFKEANLNVKVDPRTGNITLLMGQNFLFKRGSSQLNDKAKESLKKMIPIYASVLFTDPLVKENINSLNIEGHASPSFNKRYVDPLTKNNRAYEHNLNLSARRAQSIINFIFSNDIGEYDHKIAMRSLTRSVGYGFTKPINLRVPFLNRSPASLTLNCGPFDCHRSQRVEISFTLKDDKESLEKLLKLKNETGRKP